MTLINKILNSLDIHKERNALCIKSVFYTYGDLMNAISSIRVQIKEQIDDQQKRVGLVTNDDLHTYASVLALWFEGKSYIPISSDTPIQRNLFILEQTNSVTILDSSEEENELSNKVKTIFTNKLLNTRLVEPVVEVLEEDLAYILFTSGSTGLPKGVPINFKNLNTLVESIEADKDHQILPKDRCLQMFELTFDFSLVTFLLPLLYGACIYTVPKDQIKYFYIYKLIVEAKLSYLIMVPSIIHYLRPYYDEICANDDGYCCFGAAPLQLDILQEWKKCIPNATIFNSYGPTEFTVTTTYYSFEQNPDPRTRNGIVSLGKVLKDVQAIIVDEELNILNNGLEGELCLAGNQLTSGYWDNEEKNKTSFFFKTHNGELKRFYKTGDLCVKDKDDYLIFIGRKDFQVKIRGYRVELSEIEFYAREFFPKLDLQAIDFINNLGNTEIGLVIQSKSFETKDFLIYIKNELPDYMAPTQICFIDEFPLNTNGKIDRKKIRHIFN